MAATYKKLFYLLIDRGIATAELTEQAGFTLVVYCLLNLANTWSPLSKFILLPSGETRYLSALAMV